MQQLRPTKPQSLPCVERPCANAGYRHVATATRHLVQSQRSGSAPPTRLLRRLLWRAVPKPPRDNVMRQMDNGPSTCAEGPLKPCQARWLMGYEMTTQVLDFIEKIAERNCAVPLSVPPGRAGHLETTNSAHSGAIPRPSQCVLPATTTPMRPGRRKLSLLPRSRCAPGPRSAPSCCAQDRMEGPRSQRTRRAHARHRPADV